MPDPTPVPLDEIERLADEATGGPWQVQRWVDDGPYWTIVAGPEQIADMTPGGIRPRLDAAFIATADPPTVSALAKALRIAVEGLGRYGEHDTACLSNAGDSHPCDCGYDDALAAVRELVDLGEKP